MGRLLVATSRARFTGTAQKWPRQTPGPKVVPSPESQPRRGRIETVAAARLFERRASERVKDAATSP